MHRVFIVISYASTISHVESNIKYEISLFSWITSKNRINIIRNSQYNIFNKIASIFESQFVHC